MDNENQIPEQENQIPDDTQGKEEPGWFKDFVDNYDIDKPQQGDMLKGKILDIQDSSILLDVGFKRDAIIPGQDLERVDKDLRASLSVGDEIYVCVTRTPMGDDDLLVSLQKGLDHKTWVMAEELAKGDGLIDLKVVDQNRGGLLVAYENLQGFIPNSHIPAIRKGTSTQLAGEIKSDMIGKVLPVKVIEVNQKERRLVFSARVVQKGLREDRLKEIEIGSVVKSRVVNVVDFGIFVDLNGIDGLVHKSEIDWERVNNPSKLFKVGDEIEVKIVGLDHEKERVSLSRKILLPNPWIKLAEKYKVGDLAEGLVVSVLDFGAFVELQEGLQGLIHISEIGYANTEDPKSVVKKGDPVLVKIMGIEPERQRVSLSMKRVPMSEQMEWMMNLEDAAEGLLIDMDRADQEIDGEVPDQGSMPADIHPEEDQGGSSDVEKEQPINDQQVDAGEESNAGEEQSAEE
ncbi:MAG: S1 RNA-binding domain-containing protein [Anaerolineales bacterium]|nr:MAG: S1 RNA-binding domain-containing protein [Anaerolineales bacterium]